MLVKKGGALCNFGAKALEHKVEEQKMFHNISTWALNVLSLPVSNAYVERIFSIVSFMKDKYANCMGLPMLDSLLLIKTHLQAVLYLLFKQNLGDRYFL